ncbi:hypothetical protein SODALDRAFT_269054 [Sodiomyces alkalinus F11]|uniref:Chromosome segregation ATPase family protein n=1 Tax=Sodiomyces alkalinus (strain CBS 110278 / VKM F-3762 / F11) TaxID=1314773 RepID=A0A3N2Q9I5_SODAK|nr:hypothetical protein SODALDRAFT_269054 [Sodiomyces alkalinus F11]ROT43367.1 hypothetical protein SODALDRAFT_269054 [Sodiomyces alkalinus F11]
MPAVERDGSRDGERRLRHQHSSSSDHSRALIPMWDSSDPERAPPPLPLNPQSPSVSPRRGTSSAIQSAHANLAEKARENSNSSSALAKNTNDTWPEKSLVRGSHHRRIESLQSGTVRDISLLLESSQLSGPTSPTKPVEKSLRPSTPSKVSQNQIESASIEKESQVITNSPRPGPSLTPIVRPIVRRPQQSILGENTPPQSATMQALQNMQNTPPQATRDSETPLQNITNQSTSVVRVPQSLDCLSNQILSLTSIATSLQKDMSQLSRRSRDNAADLLSLKEATKARDEDIRKSLRDVLNNMHETTARISSRETYNTGLFLDSRPHQGSSPPPTKAIRPFSLPRIPSPTSFAGSIDRDSISTPSLCNSDPSTATTAILEKVLRDMSTKDGQTLLLNRLTELADKLAGMASAARVEELVAQAKKNREQAMVTVGEDENRRETDGKSGQSSRREMSYDIQSASQNDADHRSPESTKTVKLLGDDMTKAIRSVKDIVSQSGGLTAEVKALVRELRGEVLGMGREIGRRLDELDASKDPAEDLSTKEEITKIVEEGLVRMKTQMDELVREHRRLSTSATPPRPKEIDYQEIYNAMRAALRDTNASKPAERTLSRENVVDAVREAWENYKPEYERNLGLEREEILEYLTEGLQEHMQADSATPGATKEEVFQAVVEGLKHFVPPRLDPPPNLTRDEILDAVRECLEEFEFPVAPSALNAELTRDDMVYAVKQGLNDFDFPQQSVDLTHLPDRNEIASQLQEMMDYLRQGFDAASQEAKENVDASGRDVEQVLDATREGLEKLRCDMEAYVSHLLEESVRSRTQDDLAEKLTETLERFQDEIASTVAKASDESRSMIDMRMESLRDTVNSSMVPATPQVSHVDILETVKSGLDAVRAEIRRPSAGHAEVLDALHEGLADLRVGIEKIHNKPADLTANDEILEALKAGLDSVRADIDALREQSRDDQAVAILNDNGIVPTEPSAALWHEDIKNLEVLISQLRNQVEALRPATTADSTAKEEEEQVSKDDFARLEKMLGNVQECVDRMDPKKETPLPTDNASREDVQAIETILRNTKARLDDLIDGEDAVRREHVDNLQTLISETRDAVDMVVNQLDTLPRKDDVTAVESLVTQVAAGFEEMKERAMTDLEDPERVTRSHVNAVEATCHDIKAVFENMVKTDLVALASSEDVQAVKSALDDLRSKVEATGDMQSKASEDRQAEIIGVGERVSDVKTVLEEFQDLVKGKLEEGVTGMEALSKLLEGVSETVGQNANLGQTLADLSDMIRAEFEESKTGTVGAKLDTDEKLQQFTEGLGSKIDEKFAELVVKYEDFQSLSEERAKAAEARDIETEAALLSSKTMAEELKSLVDTLGSAVTDSLEKMEEASKTVFDKVEEMTVKVDGNHIHSTSEHHESQNQIKRAVETVETLQGQLGDFQPKILDAVKDVLVVVGQHHEYSKTSTTDIRDKIEEAKADIESLLPPPVEKYDDTAVHEKLDKIVDHSDATEKALSQLDVLEQIRQQVMSTASEISTFLAGQVKQIAEANEDKEKSLQETTIALERRLAEKEQVEANLGDLRAEEERLKESVRSLRAEQEVTMKQKTRLVADVSSIETALRLRREELQDMEARAQGLERRILDGIMDHSRVLLMSKAAKGKEAMSQKRVRNQKHNRATEGGERGNPPVVNLALAAKRNLGSPAQTGAGRRILSLSHINNNVASGGVSRSQSVRTPARGARSLRKNSWGGSLNKGYGEHDKENIAVREVDEDAEAETGTGTGDAWLPQDALPTIEGSVVDMDADELEDVRRSSYGTTVVTETLVDDDLTEEDEYVEEYGHSGDDAGDGQVVRYGERGEV